MVTAATVAAQTEEPSLDVWIANDTVRSLAVHDGTLYVGGTFDFVGHPTGGLAALDPDTGDLLGGLPSVSRHVSTMVPDGEGGWYVGGNFVQLDDTRRQYLAHVEANGSIDPAFDPSPSLFVNALAIRGDVLYVGGSFTSIGGVTRHGLASIDLTTGNVTDWNPDTGAIDHLIVQGDILYVGGGFVEIGGESRLRLAAFDLTTGALTAWDPRPNSLPRAIVPSPDGSRMYLGGSFSTVGDSLRSRIAAVDAVTGACLAWNPGADGTVEALHATTSGVFAGGSFDTIGGETRQYAAKLSVSTGEATSWDPSPDNLVLGLGGDEAGSSVYAGGHFTSIGGADRHRVARLDGSTGAVDGWNPGVGGPPYHFVPLPDAVVMYGSFLNVDGVVRNCLAAIDLETGEATPWDPDLGDAFGQLVWALATDGGTIYAGGAFTAVGGAPRPNLAAIDAITGLATDWNPGPDGYVRALELSGSTLYAGGDFDAVSTVAAARQNLAAFDLTTGALTAWDPGPNGVVHTIERVGESVYVGGAFTAIGGEPRNLLAALDATSGLATSWNPDVVGVPADLEVHEGTLYVGGSIETVGGVARPRVAAFDVATGALTDFATGPFGVECGGTGVLGLTVANGLLYMTGSFSSVAGGIREGIAAVALTDGSLASWYPGRLENYGGCPTGFVFVGGETGIYAAGDFYGVGDRPRFGFAVFPFTNTPIEELPDPPGSPGLAPQAFHVATARPNPSGAEVSIPFQIDQGGSVAVHVYDPSGRRLRALSHGEWLGVGRYVATWDGRDDRGRDVASGVYLVRVEHAGRAHVRRVSIVR